MTNNEFVMWIRGYLYGTKQMEFEAIRQKLDEINDPNPYINTQNDDKFRERANMHLILRKND